MSFKSTVSYLDKNKDTLLGIRGAHKARDSAAIGGLRDGCAFREIHLHFLTSRVDGLQ